MPYYIVLGNWTKEGAKNVKESPKRVATVKAAIEKSGGKFLGIYYTFGEYDWVVLAEQGASTDESMMQTLLAYGGGGAGHTKTLKAFSLAEFQNIVGKLP